MESAHAYRGDARVAFASPEEAITAFVREGWREALLTKLAVSFEREFGSASVEEAVDHALERALTKLRPSEFRDGRPVYKGPEVFRFAFKIACDRLLDERRHNAKAAAPLSGVEPDLIERVPDRSAATPETAVVERELAGQLREALVDLDEATLQVLALFHVEGVKKPRIEKLLGMSTWEVRQRLRQGNERLTASFLAVDAGATCELARDGVVRLAFGLTSGPEARRARAHVRHCGECSRRLARAQAYRNSLGALVPFPVTLGHGGALGGGLARVFRAIRRLLTRHGHSVCLGGGAKAVAVIAAVGALTVVAKPAPPQHHPARPSVTAADAGLPAPAIVRPLVHAASTPTRRKAVRHKAARAHSASAQTKASGTTTATTTPTTPAEQQSPSEFFAADAPSQTTNPTTAATKTTPQSAPTSEFAAP